MRANLVLEAISPEERQRRLCELAHEHVRRERGASPLGSLAVESRRLTGQVCNVGKGGPTTVEHRIPAASGLEEQDGLGI